MTGSTTMTTATFDALYEDVSHWERWDDGSQRGARHHLTPDRVVAAARLVRTGLTVSLGLPLDAEKLCHVSFRGTLYDGAPAGSANSEEFETSSARFLGNLTQAFSHLALIEAAGRLVVADRLKEYV